MEETQEKEIKQESIWSTPYVILLFVNFFLHMGAFMTLTTLPILISDLGVPISVVGIIVAIFPLAAVLARPFWGPAFDSFRRKRILLISQAVTGTCMILYGVVDSLPVLVAVRFVHGFFMSALGPLTMSLVSEFLPIRKLASGISIYALGNSCAQVIGPALGLYLVSWLGFGLAYALAGTSIFVALIFSLFIPVPRHKRLKFELKLDRMFAKEAVYKAIPLLLLSIAFSCVGSFVVLYGYTVGIEDMGFYFVVYACCLLATRPLFGTLADRAGSAKIVFIGIVCFIISFIVLAQARDMVGFVAAAVIGSAGFGSCAPLLQSLALGSVPVERRGAASITTFTGVDTGNLIGPIIGGAIVEGLIPTTGSEAIAYSDMWLIMLIPILAALIFVSLMIYSNRRRNRKPPVKKRRPSDNPYDY